MHQRSYLSVPLGALFLATGYWFATRLIDIPNVQVFKVLNIIGLACDFKGIAILSKFVTANEGY